VAIRTLFGDLLAWPPRIPATPMQLKQVARRLQSTSSRSHNLRGSVAKGLGFSP
jgi:hypothetical protein